MGIYRNSENSLQLSVIIPCYNAAETLAAQLEALSNQHWSESWEIILADNGSTDESISIAKSFQNKLPNLRIVDASINRGRPFAYNIGAKAAKGESIVFCDADDEVAPGWLSAIGEALSSYDFVASRFETKKLNKPPQRSHNQETGLVVTTYPPYLSHAGGSGLGIKRSLFNSVSGFDESFLLLQDTDLCFKLQLMGVKLYFIQDAVMHVRFRNSLFKIYRQTKGYAIYKMKIIDKYRSYSKCKFSFPHFLFSSFYTFLSLIKYMLLIRNKRDTINFCTKVGGFIGTIVGSFKYKVFMP